MPPLSSRHHYSARMYPNWTSSFPSCSFPIFSYTSPEWSLKHIIKMKSFSHWKPFNNFPLCLEENSNSFFASPVDLFVLTPHHYLSFINHYGTCLAALPCLRPKHMLLFHLPGELLPTVQVWLTGALLRTFSGHPLWCCCYLHCYSPSRHSDFSIESISFSQAWFISLLTCLFLVSLTSL